MKTAPISDFTPTSELITLHGLGFVQVVLPPLAGFGGTALAARRLHVWHPELPRRRCFEHSQIHNHRFGFESLVILGEQVNIDYRLIDAGDGELMQPTHLGYSHEGPRGPNGGRPWTPAFSTMPQVADIKRIKAGRTYTVQPFDYHATRPGTEDGITVTLMTKGEELPSPATSLCAIGVQPEADFDRFQWAPSRLWAIVLDALGGKAAARHLLDLEPSAE